MSTASKTVLGVSVVLTLSIVSGVHLKQSWDRERLHQGVIRDLERLQRKKENLRLLEEQRELTRVLKEDQDLIGLDRARIGTEPGLDQD